MRGKLILRWIAGSLAALVVLSAVAVWLGWRYAQTDAALARVVAEAIARSGGHLHIEGAKGSLAGTMSFGLIRWRDHELEIEAENVHVTWSPRALFSRQVSISSLTAEQVRVKAPKTSEPARLPDTLALPLAVTIDRIGIAELHYQAGGAPFTARQLAFAYQGDEQHHRVRELAVQSPIGTLNVDVEVDARKPFASSGHISWLRNDPALPVDMAIVLSGELAALRGTFTGKLGASPIEGNVVAAPFAAQWLQGLTFVAQQVDLAKIKPTLPRTLLAISVSAASAKDNKIIGALDATNTSAAPLNENAIPAKRVTGSFRIEDDRIYFDPVRIVFSNDGTAVGKASYSPQSSRVELSLNNVDLRAFHSTLRTTHLAGRVNAQIGRSITDGVMAQADIRERDLKLSFDLLQQGQELEVTKFRAEARGGVLTGKARLGLDGLRPYELSANAEGFNPATLGDFVQGRISGNIHAGGNLLPQWSSKVTFSLDEKSRLRGLPLTGSGEFAASSSQLQNASVDLRLGVNRIAAHGDLGRDSARIDFSIDAPRLAQLYPPIQGKLTAEGKISGNPARPVVTFNAVGELLQLEGTYSAARVSAHGEVTSDLDQPFSVELVANDVSLPQAQLAKATLQWNGSLRDHRIETQVEAARLNARASLRGNWQHATGWRGQILSFVEKGDYPVTLMAPAAVEIDPAHQRVRLGEAALRFADGTFSVKEFVWENKHLSSSGQFAHLPVAPFVALTPLKDDFRTSLVINGNWSIATTPRLNGSITVRRESGDIQAANSSLALGLTRLDLDVAAVEDALTAKMAATSAMASLDSRLNVARVASADPGQLSLSAPATLSASVDIASLRPFDLLTSTNAIVDGQLKMTIAGDGPLRALNVTGTVEGSGLRIESPQYGISVKEGRLRAELTREQLQLRELNLRAGDGSFTAQGVMPRDQLANAKDVTLNWTMEKFSLLNRPDARLVLDGRGAIGWSQQQLALRGQVRAAQGHFELPSDDTVALSDDVVVKGRQKPTARKPLGKLPLALDIELDLGPRMTVVGRGLDARLEGQVRVTTASDGTLLAKGSINATNATYLAFGQKLILERGRLYFDGPIDNPGVDLLALRKNMPVEAGVAVTGTAKVPLVQLVSNPPVPDGEKLSWLLLGQGLDRASSADASTLQSAAAILFASSGRSPVTSIANKIGLDDIGVHNRAGGAEGQVVSFGKRMSDKVYIAYEQGLTAAANALRLEYTLSRYLTLRAEAGTVSGFLIFFRRSYP